MAEIFDEEDMLKLKILNLYADNTKSIKVKEKAFLEWCLEKIDSGKFFDEDEFFESLIRSDFDLDGMDVVIEAVDKTGGKIVLENISPTCFSLYKGNLSKFADIIEVIASEFPYKKIYGELHRCHLVKKDDGTRPILLWFEKEMKRSCEIEEAENNADNNAESETENPESDDE